MNFELDIHTVVFLVGPSQCGKSTWSEFFSKQVKLLNPLLRCAVVSSDKSRQYILGQDLDRNDRRMLSVSAQAFSFVKSQVEILTSFPANNEFVVVDTMGFDEVFRKDLMDIAKSNGYHTAIVVFDYDYKDYFRNTSNKQLISRQVENFKKNVIPKISKKDFDFYFRVRNKNNDMFASSSVSIKSLSLWEKTQISLGEQSGGVVVVGDIHEDIESLRDMTAKFGDYKSKNFILLGDYLDKGENTVETIDFIYDWFEAGKLKIIVGNHESFVYRRLKGLVSAVDNERKNFSSLSALVASKESQEKFFYLFENSLPFVYLFNENFHAYLTHAPCQNKYLGKMSDFAQKSQRNFYFKNRSPQEMNKELAFMFEQSNKSHPMHVFGHVAHNMKNIVLSNKVWLDTGSVYRGKLTSMEIKPSGKYNFVSVQGKGVFDGTLLPISAPMISLASQADEIDGTVLEKQDNDDIKNENKDISEDLIKKFNLNAWQTKQLMDFKTLISKGVCFVSGTMTPSKAQKDKFEPIDSAIYYFKDNGVKEVFIAPKFMGSRGQIYFFKDKPTLLISRSGQMVSINQELKLVLDELKDKVEHLFKRSIVLDAEILPWSYMGKDLIDFEFKAYGASVGAVADILDSDDVWKSFTQDNAFAAQKMKEQSQIFNQQVKLYAGDERVSVRVFDVLKIDEIVNPWDYQKTFEFFNPDLTGLMLSLEDERCIELAQQYFSKITNGVSPFEGVVVKPKVFNKDIINAIKVRNENYLHIIYGHDYKDRYDPMCKSKNIRFKAELAKLHQDMGQQMLVEKNESMTLELFANILFQEKINKKYSQIDTGL